MRKQEDEVEIDLLQLFRALLKKAWVILLAAAVFAGLALTVTQLFIPPLYKARALLYVNNRGLSIGDTSVGISSGDLVASQSLVDTYIVILQTRSTMEEVIEEENLDYTYEELTKMVKASAVNSTEVFYIEVTSEDPREAEQIANALARVLPEKISAIVEGTSVRIVDNAVVPIKKASPSRARNTIFGGLIGFVLACGAVIVMQFMDDEIHNSDYLLQNYDIPVLAVIPDLTATGEHGEYGGYGNAGRGDRKHGNKKKKSIVLPPAQSRNVIGPNLNFAAAEAYKLLRTNLEFSLVEEGKCKVIGVTSSLAGEGKSTTAVNIAYTIAQTEKKVLLLEADLRLPTTSQRLGVQPRPGLSNLLVGQCSGDDIIQQSGLIRNLYVITAGDMPPNPSELLASEAMRATIRALQETFDVMIMDLPPANVVSDSLVLSRSISGAVIVVRQNYCEKKALDTLVRQLKFSGAKILGFVMTDSDIQKKNYRSCKKGNYDSSYEKADKEKVSQ